MCTKRSVLQVTLTVPQVGLVQQGHKQIQHRMHLQLLEKEISLRQSAEALDQAAALLPLVGWLA